MKTFWIICTIIAIIFVVLTIRNLYEISYNGNEEKVTLARGIWLLIIIACLTPVINLMTILTLCLFLIYLREVYKVKGPVGKCINWLTTKV